MNNYPSLGEAKSAWEGVVGVLERTLFAPMEEREVATSSSYDNVIEDITVISGTLTIAP